MSSRKNFDTRSVYVYYAAVSGTVGQSRCVLYIGYERRESQTTQGLARARLLHHPCAASECGRAKVKPVEPEFMARQLLKALPTEKFMIIPTFDGALAYRLSWYAPALLHHFVKRRP